jgi:hypothetical protein
MTERFPQGKTVDFFKEKMKYNKIHEGIVEIPNFLSKDCCQEIINYVVSFPEELWLKKDSENWDGRILSDFQDVKFNLLRRNVGDKIQNLFDSYYQIVNNYTTIQRILPNTNGLSEHRDNINDPDVKYGLVLYYNEDYTGGEIEYSEIGISYKPREGSLIIHRGEYLHKVNPVVSGIRYMSTFFVHEIDGHPAKLKEIDI